VLSQDAEEPEIDEEEHDDDVDEPPKTDPRPRNAKGNRWIESTPPLHKGDTIGWLTLGDPVGRMDGHILWECSCQCGNVVIRPAHALKSARDRGVESKCRACLAEKIRGRLALTREARYMAWRASTIRRFWEATGKLYGDQWAVNETHRLREESGLPDPIDLPPTPYTVDDDVETSWQAPEIPDDGMTLEEIGKVLGVTRERVRQIEAIALRKLRRNLEKLDRMAENHRIHHEVVFNQAVGDLPQLPQRRRVLPRPTPPPVETPEPVEDEPVAHVAKKDRWDRNNLGIPEGCKLAGEVAAGLGWSSSTFHNRTLGWQPSGYVNSPVGTQWAYWSQERIDELREKWKDGRVRQPGEGTKKKQKLPPRRRIFEVTPPFVDATEAFPALLVVKAKVSGISMTLPVFVQQIARSEHGNHQVKVKLAGSITDSILDKAIIVWAQDLLTMDYSPYKTPWD
jgi:transcriptional regulator with XRE-family HTH domain